MKLSEPARKMLFVIFIVSVVFIAARIIYNPLSSLPFTLGLVLTAGLSALKVRMLDRAIDKAVDMEKNKAARFIQLQNIFRLVLTGVVLMFAALSSAISLLGATIGILTWPIAAYSLRIFIKSD